VEEGAISKARWWPMEVDADEVTESPLGASRRNQPSLDFSPVKLLSDFQTPEQKNISLCSLKPLCLWLFFTVAMGNESICVVSVSVQEDVWILMASMDILHFSYSSHFLIWSV
jgi:hypothetical protein